jgi:sec-independent protein translocase protein TatA
MSLGVPELIIILIIVLLLFGAARLPRLARSLGEASREFKKGVSEREQEEQAEQAAKAAPAAPSPQTAPTPPPAANDPNEQVTMSRAELDALLAERERNASKDVPPPAQG